MPLYCLSENNKIYRPQTIDLLANALFLLLFLVSSLFPHLLYFSFCFIWMKPCLQPVPSLRRSSSGLAPLGLVSRDCIKHFLLLLPLLLLQVYLRSIWRPLCFCLEQHLSFISTDCSKEGRFRRREVVQEGEGEKKRRRQQGKPFLFLAHHDENGAGVARRERRLGRTG